MPNKYLMREDTPFGPEIWEILDAAAIEAAKSELAGRRLLPLEGPFGLGLKAVSLKDAAAESGLIASQVLPVPLIHKTFMLSPRDLATFEREGVSLNTNPVVETALACARMEDDLIFNGAPGVPGLLTVEGANELMLSSWEEVGMAANDVIQAVTALDHAGFHGPYALALAPSRYNLLYRLYPHGMQSELQHVMTVATEGVFKAPILEDGGVVLVPSRLFASIILGQDLQVGFIGPVEDKLELSISESLTLCILEPGAICALRG
jgi:uncharacterized linocin/CFP29 family protein